MPIVRDQKGDSWLSELLVRVLTRSLSWPSWVKPPAVGALLLLVITFLRGVIMIPVIARDPAQVLNFLGALVVAPAAGAVAGFAYLGIRPPLRFLGVIGDLVTGVVLATVYMFAILVPGKYLFGDNSLATRTDWIETVVIAAGFGIVGTITYWYHRRNFS
jgi:hypothetical protein